MCKINSIAKLLAPLKVTRSFFIQIFQPGSVRKDYCDFAASSACHESIGFIGFLDREFIGDQISRMDAPAYESVYQIHHSPCRCYP